MYRVYNIWNYSKPTFYNVSVKSQFLENFLAPGNTVNTKELHVIYITTKIIKFYCGKYWNLTAHLRGC